IINNANIYQRLICRIISTYKREYPTEGNKRIRGKTQSNFLEKVEINFLI
ncbi:unnamed protein product, partial [marine sediment metagenome]